MIPIPPWAYAAAATVVVIGSFGAGWKVRAWRCDAALLKVERTAEKERARLQAKVEQTAQTYEDERYADTAAATARETRIRTIYRDRPVRADCAAPDDARRVLADGVERANARAIGEPVSAVPADPAAADPSR